MVCCDTVRAAGPRGASVCSVVFSLTPAKGGSEIKAVTTFDDPDIAPEEQDLGFIPNTVQTIPINDGKVVDRLGAPEGTLFIAGSGLTCIFPPDPEGQSQPAEDFTFFQVQGGKLIRVCQDFTPGVLFQ